MEYILLLNGRRRVYIVKKIKEYLRKSRLDIGIAVTDTNNLDPVGYYADKFNILPEIESENFEKEFIKYLIKENIKYIFLWNNKDFYYIHKIKSQIIELGINLILPSMEIIDICFNKKNTYEFCKKYKILTPDTYLTVENFIKNDNTYPVIVKPYDGAGNLNVFKADNYAELEVFFKKVKNPIIQKYIDGEHYTIDTFYDEKLGTVCSIPRKRVKVRDAEVVQAKIILDNDLVEVGYQISNNLKAVGPLNIQVIKSKDKIYTIDMHSRFGGGTDLTIEAGVPIHKWIVNFLIGKNNVYSYKINSNLFMTRYLKSDFIKVEK